MNTPPMQSSPMPSAPNDKSWFSRNWMWLAGGGCLSIVLCCGGLSAVFYAIGSKAKDSIPVVESLAKANADKRVTAALGRPVTLSGFPSLEAKSQNGRERLSAAVDVSGPEGEGTLVIDAEKKDNSTVWRYRTQEIRAKGQVFELSEPSLKDEDDQDAPEPSDDPDDEGDMADEDEAKDSQKR
jgi:Cytochrome oxidase complex assembly protein 1